MTDYSENLVELHELLEEVFEDCIDEARAARLEELLKSDHRARQEYLSAINLHGTLLWGLGGKQDANTTPESSKRCPELSRVPRVEATSPVVSSESPATVSPHSPILGILSTTIHGTVGYCSSGWPVAYLIATVIFGIGLMVGALVHVSDPVQTAQRTTPLPSHLSPLPSTVGRITGMVDCKWADPSKAPAGYDDVSLGRAFNLESGLMEITYDTGAKVILQGPVTYKMEANGGYLSVGKLTGKLDKEVGGRGTGDKSSLQPSAFILHPFVIRTPTATVTDLGTEFGVTVSEGGRTQVHVLQGVVEAQIASVRGGVLRNVRVTEGHAVEVAPKAEQFKEVAFVSEPFTRVLRVPTVDTPAEAAYIQAVLADRPMGYWPLNEPAGSRKFVDHSGHGVHGYAMNKVQAGQPGPISGARAIELDGGGYIDLGYHPEFAMKNDFTVEAWAWIGEVKQHSMIFSVFGDGELPIGWTLMAGHATPERPVVPQFSVNRVKDIDFRLPTGEVIGGRWLHYAVVFDRTNTAHLYLNGEHRDSVAVGATVAVQPLWLAIGAAEQAGPAESVDSARCAADFHILRSTRAP